MSVFGRLRLYHSVLAALAVLAYVTQDWTWLHRPIGYSLLTIVGLRIAALVLAPHILPRPAWLVSKVDHHPTRGLQNPLIGKALIAGIMLALALTLSTGLMLEPRRPAESADLALISPAHADEDHTSKTRKRSRPEHFLKEVHEVAANGLFAAVGLHIAYLVIANRRYALKMIFMDKPR
jgi:cytochrome b